MGEGLQRIEVSAWRQADVENHVILGLQVTLGKEELWDDFSDMSVTNGDRLGMTVKEDPREAGYISLSGQGPCYLEGWVGGVLSKGLW